MIFSSLWVHRLATSLKAYHNAGACFQLLVLLSKFHLNAEQRFRSLGNKKA